VALLPRRCCDYAAAAWPRRAVRRTALRSLPPAAKLLATPALARAAMLAHAPAMGAASFDPWLRGNRVTSPATSSAPICCPPIVHHGEAWRGGRPVAGEGPGRRWHQRQWCV